MFVIFVMKQCRKELEMENKRIINKKSVRGISAIIIVAIVAIVVVAVGVGVYLGSRSFGTSPNASTTSPPSSTPTSTSSPSPAPASTSAPSSTPTSKATPISDASSYSYNYSLAKADGTVIGYGYVAAQNLGTSNVEIYYVDISPGIGINSNNPPGVVEYIANGILQKAWGYSDGTWTDLSANYASQLSSIESAASIYLGVLGNFNGPGNTFTSTTSGETFTFTNIQINPSLPNSMFQAPS
jgi:hypothetical protein